MVFEPEMIKVGEKRAKGRLPDFEHGFDILCKGSHFVLIFFLGVPLNVNVI